MKTLPLLRLGRLKKHSRTKEPKAALRLVVLKTCSEISFKIVV